MAAAIAACLLAVTAGDGQDEAAPVEGAEQASEERGSGGARQLPPASPRWSRSGR